MTDRELLQQALGRLASYENQFGANALDLETINAIRARLAEPEKAKPVAWMNPYGGILRRPDTGLERSTYTIPLYLHPPRPAVRLSDEEIDDIAIQHDFLPRFIRAIESAVLKKNGLEVKDD